MTQQTDMQASSHLLSAADEEALNHMTQAISCGKHWYIALLEAIGLWQSDEETYDGRTYRYVIAGEAFDWLLLAQRLCESTDSLISEDEKNALLFHGQPPLNITIQEFGKLIGNRKFNQYLNYFYGVIVEECLIMAVQEEVRKERSVWGLNREDDIANEAYRRIYDATRATLLRRFRQGKGYAQVDSISLTELKEFTYWLFQYRLKECDKARVASDTKKGLDWLKANSVALRPAD